MTTFAYLGLTGCGYQNFDATGTHTVCRVEVTDVGSGGTLFPFGTPQRYGGIGWVSGYDSVPSGFDGVFPHDMLLIINPVTWIDTLQFEIDMSPLNTDILGVSGLAYALVPGASIDVYLTEF